MTMEHVKFKSMAEGDKEDYLFLEAHEREAAGVVGDRLLDALKAYLERRNLQANWDDAAKASNEALVNALAAACPFGPQEKQALLEAATVADRAALMIALCEMDVGGNGPAALH